jgi:hypothetical protein
MSDELKQQQIQAALLTKHHKLALISPALSAVGIQVIATDAFDTDTLGSFSGETPRRQTPQECARTKAKLAAELTGLLIGIGSEGSFGGGPYAGLVNWDDELLLLLDTRTGQEMMAFASGPVPLASLETDQLAAIAQHLQQHDAAQGWICSYGEADGQGRVKGMVKGLVGFEEVKSALSAAGLLLDAETLSETIKLQPDLRAHLCPARQSFIQQAAQQLAERWVSLCPSCHQPNFWRKAVETGLPCEVCHYPTGRIKSYTKKCDCCGYIEQEPSSVEFADQGHCPLCNP